MTKDEILIELEKIYKEVLDDDSIELKLETNADDIEAWDSMSNIHLIIAQENKFNIRFDLGQISELKNISELIDVIYNDLQNKWIRNGAQTSSKILINT